MTKTERVNARITKADKDKLKRYCDKKDISFSQWVTERIHLMRLK